MDKATDTTSSCAIQPLLEVMETLLGPQGCPWDKEQTHQSLRKNLLEEAHEVIETIDNHDMTHMKEELGDLLLQIVFHAKLAEVAGHFSFEDVVQAVTDKMVRRHPHIFGDVIATDAQQVLGNWEEIKRKEKSKDQQHSIMGGLPPTLPALMRAQKVQEKARRVGFDWADIQGPWDKIHEELDELKQAIAQQSNVAEEFGDLLFSMVNLSRFIAVDPEETLKHSTNKFISRFQYIENKTTLDKRAMEDYTIEELEQIWQQAKNVSGKNR